MAEIKVELSKEYTAHEKTFKEIVLREPTYAEICMEGLGRPQEWQRMADGSAMLITYASVVDSYLKKIVVSPGYESITGLSAKDTIKLQEVVCGFFI
jgi:hypothetical protein